MKLLSLDSPPPEVKKNLLIFGYVHDESRSASSIAERLELYRRIEELRGRPLVLYVTSMRPNAEGAIAADAIPELLVQLGNEVVVFVHHDRFAETATEQQRFDGNRADDD